MLFKFWVPKNHKHPHFHLQEIPWTLSASGEPFLVEREHHSLTIIKCTLNKYLELATLSYWIYTGRRKIPNQISARGIVISSSWKGDGWDWLCCVFYTHTHTQKEVFSWQPTLWISHRKTTVCSENNTSVAVNIRSRLLCVSQHTKCMAMFYSDSFTVM